MPQVYMLPALHQATSLLQGTYQLAFLSMDQATGQKKEVGDSFPVMCFLVFALNRSYALTEIVSAQKPVTL